MTSIDVVFVGLIIRIAVPLLVMIGLVFVLRRLDARWQKEALMQQKLEERLLQEKVKVLHAKDCPISGPAGELTPEPGETCWQVYRRINGKLRDECLQCKVFRATSILLPS